MRRRRLQRWFRIGIFADSITHSLSLCLEDPSRILVSLETAIRIANISHQCLQAFTFPNLSLLGVFAVEYLPQDEYDDYVRHKIPQCKSMAQKISRATFRPVQLCSNHSTEITNGDLHGVGNGSLCLARDIVGGPG